MNWKPLLTIPALTLALIHTDLPAEETLPLVLSEDFEKADAFDQWFPTQKDMWTLPDTGAPQGRALRVNGKSDKYHPPFRSPHSIALLKDKVLGDFVLTARVQTLQTSRGHRDMCIFWGWQDDSHFYYVHLGEVPDPNSSQIFIVKDAPRTPITKVNKGGVPWQSGKWHDVKLVRKAAEGLIEVYFDDMQTPLKTANDTTFAWGLVGLGTFDDLGMWDDVRINGVSVSGEKPVLPTQERQGTTVEGPPKKSAAAASAGFTIARNDHGVSISVNGSPFADYVIDQANKPYLWPIYGPTGKQMTRAYPMQELDTETKEQRDHPHHRGVTFGHESIGGGTWKFPKTNDEWKPLTGDEKHTGGGDTWHESKTFEEFMTQPKNALRGKQRLPMVGSIKHREFTELKADKDKAVIVELCDYLDPAGKRFLTEERVLTFHAGAASRSIDVDQTFTASDGEIRFDDRKDAGLSIRIPASMAVDSKQGGQIINSDGVTDKDAWGKAAKWCDYHGPVGGEHLGIAFLSHPSSYRYPTRWHVRGYGLFTANPFAQSDYDKTLPDGTTTLKQGEQLKLRHRLLFHSGDAASAKIEEAWQEYAK